jgi:hypothetical protein
MVISLAAELNRCAARLLYLSTEDMALAMPKKLSLVADVVSSKGSS